MTTVASLFHLAGPDVIVVGFIIILLVGIKKLPEIVKGLGQAARELRSDSRNEKEEPVDGRFDLTAASVAIILIAIVTFCAKLAETN